MDAISERKIKESIDRLSGTATTIVIAHRLSTIINAERIVAIDNGRIIESGTYEELIKKNGFFADLVRRQMLSDAEEAEEA